jgi:hypothetical protein
MLLNVIEPPAQIGVGDKVKEALGFFEILIGATVPIVGPDELVAVNVAPKQFGCAPNVCPQEIVVYVCDIVEGIVDCV